MSLEIETKSIPDPTGHGRALLLRGDWVFVMISDGTHTGLGEATHSGDDDACVRKIHGLFDEHVREQHLSLEGIRSLEQGAFSEAQDFLTATAISGLNQALFDLLARQNRVPVWNLFVEKPAQGSVQLYLTVNRALTTRTEDDYLATVSSAMEQGFGQIKCAPFEAVTMEGDQLKDCRAGLSILRLLRSEFPDLDLRIDFHKRFTHSNFLAILPELEELSPHWIEEPCGEVALYADLRDRTRIPLAAGELFFGTQEFAALASAALAGVIMPDVKHVGGFGPLIEVCNQAAPLGVAVSPHNPSGPVSSFASVHAAAIAPNVTSVETSLFSEQSRAHCAKFIDGDQFRVPDRPGWGLEVEELFG